MEEDEEEYEEKEEKVDPMREDTSFQTPTSGSFVGGAQAATGNARRLMGVRQSFGRLAQ
eukprot:SAG22_NODE_99_length_20560_cov_128.669029_25_plen_59_part_00